MKKKLKEITMSANIGAFPVDLGSWQESWISMGFSKRREEEKKERQILSIRYVA
jgi:hypothetical protein